MNVQLAGFNIDADLIRELSPNLDSLTPESISAAYARISRSPKDIPSLRREARKDVLKARRSNQKIIFSMGHHSIAEHAIFNFDIMGISRLALEELEQFRLVSYTEKSQRYVTLNGDAHLPEEITDPGDREAYIRQIQRQNDLYKKFHQQLWVRLTAMYPDLATKPSGQTLLDGYAKEDSRYCLALATEGQVGMTINARNLEHLFRKLSRSRLIEARALGSALFRLVEPIAPSLILFPDASAFDQDIDSWRSEVAAAVSLPADPDSDSVRIIDVTPQGDERILAAALAHSRGCRFETARQAILALPLKEKKRLFLHLFRQMEFFDTPPREFETVEILFQAVVSSSCFAQLKRHRIATLLTGPYESRWATTIPAAILEIGGETEFNSLINTTEELHRSFSEKYGAAADYILTNAHRRTILMKMNLREFFHFIRLRDDEHAQWDIRNLARRLVAEIRSHVPLAALLLCGKSGFAEEFEKLYRKPPRAST